MASYEAFNVCVHDVCPQTRGQVDAILGSLRRLVGTSISLAVVPQYRGVPWGEHASAHDWAKRLAGTCDEVLLHGFTHRRSASLDPFSGLVGRADEFTALGGSETLDRLVRGRRQLEELFGREVEGVLPPAWRAGNIAGQVRAAGLRFVVGMSAARAVDGSPVPLATWSWDAGVIGPLGRALELWGTFLSIRARAVPCVAIHPADVRRGSLPRAIALIDRLLEQGATPLPFAALVRGGAVGAAGPRTESSGVAR